MNNKYYEEIKISIKNFLENKEFDKVLKIINEELSMPYIPMGFENFLLKSLEEIPSKNLGNDFTLSLEKVIDLLIQLDGNKENFIELVNQLRKYNLSNSLDDVNYYFIKSQNKRHKIQVFDILCEQNVDIELDYGNPSNTIAIKNNNEFILDRELINSKLDKYPLLIEPSIELLYEIYLTTHTIKENDNKEYADLVIYTISKLFNQKEIQNLVKDKISLKNKIENFKPLHNL